MNTRIKELAERAGFVLWADEPWNPGDVIDWSNRYDAELEKFAQLLIDECQDVVIECDEDPKLILGEPYRRIVNKIGDHFSEITALDILEEYNDSDI
jgi:hypothetical protein